jgi:hypothetical protein
MTSNADDRKFFDLKRILTPKNIPRPQPVRLPVSPEWRLPARACGHVLFWIGAALSLPGAALAEFGARMIERAEERMSKDTWKRR